jgi:hypothetical protein
MSTINTLLIKRRLPDSNLTSLPVLSGGELAFSEKNYTLYYGASGLGSIPIAGSGAFVDLITSQTVAGDKTFNGTTTLSSVTVSSDSTLDFGGNKLTNIGTPENDSDATTKLYVDNAVGGLSGNYVEKVEDEAVTLNGGLTVSSGLTSDDVTTTGSVTVGTDLTVNGNLSVLGSTTTIDTIVTTTSAFSITNDGSGPALLVTQTGAEDIATFFDDSNTALIIKDGGNVGINTSTPNEQLTISGNVSSDGTFYGAGLDIGSGATATLFVGSNVGIGTETPNEELTVVGTISATEDIYAVNGNFTGTLGVEGDFTGSGSSNLTGFVIDGGSF